VKLSLKCLKKTGNWTTLNFLLSHKMINLNYEINKGNDISHIPESIMLARGFIKSHVIDLWLKLILFMA
jgi:hypothetical protein